MLARRPDAHRLDGARDVLHRVVDRETGGDAAARAVDVEVDVAGAVVLLQVEELADQEVRDRVVDRRPEEDDPILEQAAPDVVLPLAAPRALDDDRVGDVGVGALGPGCRSKAKPASAGRRSADPACSTAPGSGPGGPPAGCYCLGWGGLSDPFALCYDASASACSLAADSTSLALRRRSSRVFPWRIWAWQLGQASGLAEGGEDLLLGAAVGAVRSPGSPGGGPLRRP